MKGKIRLIAAALALASAVYAGAAFCGCGGGDTVNIYRDVSVYDLYEAAKSQPGKGDLTLDEFLKEYLSYTSEELEEKTSLQASINRSLLSCVSIRAKITSGAFTMQQLGSGIIIELDKNKGDITVLTNCHVVRSGSVPSSEGGYADDVAVWLYGSEYIESRAISAKVIAASAKYDVALLKITGSDVVKNSYARAAVWSDDETNYIGATVYAVGNANGYKMSADVGYVSKDIEKITVDMGTGEEDRYDYRVIRTSAAINHGNSGGGLFGADGRLIGLVNSKNKSSEVNMGYALPASSTKRVVARLKAAYAAAADKTKPVCGLQIVDEGFSHGIGDSYSTGLNDRGFAEMIEEVWVTRIENGSPLYGDIWAGDIITGVKVERGGQVIEDVEILRYHNLLDVLVSVEAGDEVTYSYTREGDKDTVKVTYTAQDMRNVN